MKYLVKQGEKSRCASTIEEVAKILREWGGGEVKEMTREDWNRWVEQQIPSWVKVGR